MTVLQDELNALIATLASINTVKVGLTSTLTNLVNLFNSNAQKSKITPVFTSYVLQFNQLTTLTDSLMKQSAGILASSSSAAPPPPSPVLNLSSATITDAALVGDTIGTLSVTNGVGVYTYTFTSNAGTLFSISGSLLKVAALLTAGSDSITVKADNGSGSVVTRTFLITVTVAGTTQQWQPVNIGGGGFVTGVGLVASDGTQVIRTDVYGAYVNTPSVPTWRQMQTGTAFGNQNSQSGPYEVVIAKSDSTRIYMVTSDGFLYKSTDTGHTFTKVTALNSGVALSGDYGGNRSEDGTVFASRFNGRFMAVDPHDPNVVYLCSQTNGVFLTLDGGTSWQTVSGIPSATTSSGISLGTLVAIDGNAAPINGRSPKVYIMAYGSQMYKCSNGGSATPTFAATTSGPTTICAMEVDSDGTVVYVADGSTNFNGPGGAFSGTVWQYMVGTNTWVNLLLGSHFIHAIAPDPATAGRVVFSDDAGGLYVSTTHGSSPTSLALGTKDFTDIPWMGLTPNTFYTGGIAFNPSTSKLVLTQGIGVVTSTPPNSGTVNWTNQTVGIEELVMNFISWSPSYTYPLVGAWDRPLFSIVDPSAFPATQYPNNSRAITMGWASDWAKSAPGTQVAIVNFDGAGDDSGITTDRLTWTPFATKPNKVRLVTSAPSALGSGTLTFASVPSLIAPSTLGGNRQATYLGIAAVTTAPSAADSRVLHFGNGLPGTITTPCNVSTDEKQVINGLLFDSALALNYLGVTGDVQLDAGPHVTVPSGTTIFFRVSGNPINGNVTVGATTGTTITMSGEPSGHAILAGETIEFTTGKAGCVAASTPNNILWCGSNDEPYPWYTKDGGATWANAVIGTSVAGFGSSGQALPNLNGDGTGWGHAYYINTICFAADAVTPNRFVGYNGRQLSADGGGIYTSDNSGDTWTKRVSGQIDANGNGYNSRLLAVSGNAHHFLLCAGRGNLVQNSHLMWSIDTNNATWNQIANVSNVMAFCIGAAAPGKDYPCVYLVGKVSGVAGIWRGEGNLTDWQSGTNTGTTIAWTNINGTFGENPMDWLDGASAIEGDPNVYGRVFVARGHSGVVEGYLG